MRSTERSSSLQQCPVVICNGSSFSGGCVCVCSCNVGVLLLKRLSGSSLFMSSPPDSIDQDMFSGCPSVAFVRSFQYCYHDIS